MTHVGYVCDGCTVDRQVVCLMKVACLSIVTVGGLSMAHVPESQLTQNSPE